MYIYYVDILYIYSIYTYIYIYILYSIYIVYIYRLIKKNFLKSFWLLPFSIYLHK